MDKYNKPRVFLYLDPHYLSSEKKYRNNFTIRDLKDQNGKMDNHLGFVLDPVIFVPLDSGELFIYSTAS